ncbi:MAG: hypothetical protein OHK0015_01690 [Chloroflexi bacterium OHK40]
MFSNGLAGASTPLEVLIELDVAQRCCGVAPGEPAHALTWKVAHLLRLRLLGL